MKQVFLMILSFILGLISLAQETRLADFLEATAAQAEETTEADDDFLMEADVLFSGKVNLNTVTESALRRISGATEVQLAHFFKYRKVIGPFLSVYELQAVPGWDINLCHKLSPYLTVGYEDANNISLKNRFKRGEHLSLFRFGRDAFVGHVKDTWLGDGNKLLFRYRYQYGQFFQWGITSEKDAGEPFFKNGNNVGFDFYSVHFFLRRYKFIHALALGDYRINLGQGLLVWQSLSLGMGAEVLSVKRQEDALRPHQSSGENGFFRGAAITIGRAEKKATFFISHKEMDANRTKDSFGTSYITSFQNTGIHRTAAEMKNKGILNCSVAGLRVQIPINNFELGINTLYAHFGASIQKADKVYNNFSFNGNRLFQASIDYSYTFRNMHLFGELAKGDGLALLSGLMMNVATTADVALVYRNYSPRFYSLFGNAFGAASSPVNEKGLYAAIRVQLHPQVLFSMYADYYKNPFFKFRLNHIGRGSSYLVTLRYMPQKRRTVELRYTSRMLLKNEIGMNPISEVVSVLKTGIRLHFQFPVSNRGDGSCRVEWNTLSGGTSGFLFFADVKQRLPKSTTLGARIQLSGVHDFDNRLYVFEPGVKYAGSIVMVNQSGLRFLFNVNKIFMRKITLSASISGGLDAPKTAYSPFYVQSLSYGLQVVFKK